MSNYLQLHLEKEAVNALSSAALAHVGDSVYELMVRSYIVCQGRQTSAGLHQDKIHFVSAAAQATALNALYDHLSEEEATVCRRGRNAHVHSIPKHANVGQYHAATALECLFGYLYLLGETDRLNELFSRIMDILQPSGTQAQEESSCPSTP